MKVRTIISIVAAAFGLTSTALSDKYDDLVTKGYRWVTTDGPFACASKDDVDRITKNQSDENLVRMLEQGRVYFLIRGTIVQVVQEDKASGMSQIRRAGIVENLWTPTKFLSERPIVNILGTIATPSRPIGVTSDIDGQLGATATPIETATPNASPTP